MEWSLKEEQTSVGDRRESLRSMKESISPGKIESIFLASVEGYKYCSSTLAIAYSSLPSWLTGQIKHSQQIQDLQKNKEDFESQLTVSYFTAAYLSDDEFKQYLRVMCQTPPHDLNAKTIDLYLNSVTEMSLNMFLIYCYNHAYDTNDRREENMQQLASDKSLVNEFKNAQIDGYSAIGAAILAPDESIKSKRNFIEQLIHLGFKLTQKDKMLAGLPLYDAIPENEKEKMILFLRHKDILPEINKNIVSCMMEPYRATSWPLPDSTNDEK